MDNEQEATSFKDFLSSLASGKYTKWAVNLDEQTLWALFWALGEFGYRAEMASEANRVNIHIGDNVSVEREGAPAERMRVALTAIIEIVGGKKMTLLELKKRIVLACVQLSQDS